jgi:phage host-nuclease inhibitor protein Gam
MSKDTYIQTLKQSPAMVKQLGDTSDANTLLNINTPETKAKISDGYSAAISKAPLPAQVITKAKEDFAKQQDNYNKKIVNAFSESLHTIFVSTAAIMGVALVLSFVIKERSLEAARPEETPGA